MKKNLGFTDQIARWVIAAIIYVLYAVGALHGVIGNILLVVAVIITITGLLGWCPIYLFFGLNTYVKKVEDEFTKL